jgi:L-ribulose-5-phosphate 3-epimerase
MILYGSGEPIEALGVLGRYVYGAHAKDGTWPKQPGELGEEKPLGEGQVGIDRYVAKLKEIGYTGAITIEREISGPQQIEDIRRAIRLLESLR